MKWISTTIKKIYLDKILTGEKRIERKVGNEFWEPRLTKALHELACGREVGLNLLCSQKNHKFKVKEIEKIVLPTGMRKEIDGVKTQIWFEIHIGDEIK